MKSPIQFARLGARPIAAQFPSSVFWRVGAFFGFLVLTASLACAQDASSGMIGRIEGTDISVQGPSTPGNDNETRTPSILVGNGSVVTVHAGDARLTLVNGGEIDICGPAKFTMLQSGGAITLALDFGRMRVELPAAVSLRLFTPRIVATPIDISGGRRDVTVGLDLDESLCVLASSGAIQLEHQFSGEKLIVPQAGEFFLSAGQLLPVAGKPGSCQCNAIQNPPARPSQPQEYAANVAPLSAPVAPQLPPAMSAPAAPAAAQPRVEFSIPAHANETHPLPPPPKAFASASLPAESSLYTVVAPLSYAAGTPLPPPDPPIDTVLLVREAQVQPDWEFKGHVDAPNFAAAMQHALGEGAGTREPTVEPRKKRSGFWGFWRKIFD